jgi:tRNA1(Val) A37 N6-methylase TrmN6
MSIKVIGSAAKIHTLSNSFNSFLSKEHGILYVGTKGLGQVTRDTAAGLTPGSAFEERYNGMKSAMTGDFIANDLFVFDTIHGEDFDYDDGVRKLINNLFVKGKIPFNANVGTIQKENTNSEALISYDREKHLDILVGIIKQYFGLEIFFDTKDPIIWRFKQEEDIEEIFERLIQYRLCLYAAYTSRGKTKISIETAVRLCQQGGIVLVTTPITDTKKSFEENVNDFHFGADRNLKVTYMDSTEFTKHSVTDLRQRADAGELIFVVLTVQDLRYGEDVPGKVDADTKELRAKYHALNGNVNLWIRDERHAQYGGEVTSQRLANMTAEYELDLTATPYNVLDKYNWEQIVSRTLLWGLKYKEHTKLPTIRIDAVSTLLSNVSPKIAAMYSEEEGFDPRKLFVRDNGKFILRAELLDIRDKMYHDTSSKKKNLLSIVNDKELSDVATTCGFWVLPEGQDGDGASDYIPDLAALLNTNGKTYFTDSYTLEKECPKTTTIGKYIDSLVKQHGRVIILTCGKFLTGTDIPALGHIVLMAKMNNIANFEQLLGRMIREYPGKDEVKMYCFAPAMEIGLVQGKMAKITSKLGGGSEYEILECIPLTEYTTNGPRKISPNTILAEVQEFFKRLSKDRLPSASLESALAGVDLSVWEGLDTKKFKKSAPKAGVTEDNGAKVKNKLGDNPNTGKPYTKNELNTITQIANAIQTVIVEAKWIAYSINNYDYSEVLSNLVLAKMFPEEIDAVIDTIENDAVIKDMVVKNLNDKHFAYKGLAPIDVYDDIFMNNEYKKNIGLVYVNFGMAKELVDKLPKSKYNKEGVTICVFNALSGTIPLLLKEKFPKARIVCAEYFEYFKEHLKRLGFEVVGIAEDKDGNLYLDKDNAMKFDVVIGNPPYQDGDREDQANKLWPQFVKKAYDLVKDNGHVAMITPNGWMQPTADIGKGTGKNALSIFNDIFKKNNLIVANVDSDNIRETHFKGVGSTFSYYLFQKAPYSGSTEFITPTGGVLVDISKIDSLPKVTSKESLSIVKKMVGTPFAFCDQNHGLNGFEGACQGTVTVLKKIKGVETAINYKLQHAIYHTNKNNGTYWFGENLNPYASTPKVIISLSGTYLPVFNNTTGFSNMCLAVICKTDDEAKRAQCILSSKLYKFWVEMQKFSGFNPRKLILTLPELLLTKDWIDADIYKHFGLTQEEIDYVEANVK